MSNSEQTYLYSVNPKKPIKSLRDVPVIRVAKSLYLTKQDVYECLKCGSVYRRFANENRNERVTIANVDRMHNSKYMTEEEYATFIANKLGETGKVVEAPVVNPEPVTVAPEPVVEDVAPVVVPETDVVEAEPEVVETVADTDTVVEEDSVDVVEAEPEVVETADEETSDIQEQAPVERQNNQKNYGGKNKHR